MTQRLRLKKFLIAAAVCANINTAGAVDVTNSGEFASAFNDANVTQITVMNDISLVNALNPRDNLTINISGNTGTEILTLNGNTLRFIPNWPNTLQATIADLTLQNATSGAVEMSGNGNGNNAYSIDTVTFLNNSNSGGNGGGSYVHAQVANGTGATYSVANSTFTNNSAQNGGGVYNSSDNSSPGLNIIFNMTDDIFVGNTATSGNGGAIYNNSNNGAPNNTFTVTGGTFTNNSAPNGTGGAVYNEVFNSYGGTSTFTVDGTFTGNIAQSVGAVANEVIGGTATNTFSVSGTFTGNSASGVGGAVSAFVGVTGNSPYGGSNTFDINGTFSANTAGSSGGAAYINLGRGGSTAAVNLSGTFTGNKAANGGAIYNTGNNYSGNAEAQGALSIADGTTFTANSASGSGGAIYNDNQGYINITAGTNGINFTGNTAGTGRDIYQAGSEGVINFNGAGTVTMDGGIAGAGTINQSNGGTLTLSAGSDSFGYTGVFNETGGSVAEFYGTVFGGQNNITDSTLFVQSDQSSIYYNANLYNNSTLTHVSTNTGVVRIVPAASLTSAGINFLGSNVSANFSSGLPGDATGTALQTAFELTQKLDNGQANNVTFTNALVTLGSTDYTGGTSYQMLNTLLDLANSSSAEQNYNFSNLLTNNTNINFKVTDNGVPSGSLISDTLNTAAGGGTVGINRIYIYDTTGAPLIGDVQVLSGDLTFNSSIPAAQYSATTSNQYTITVEDKGNGTQWVKFADEGASDDLTLDKVNYNSMGATGPRSFQINSGIVYQNQTSLHEMAEGTFTVYGQDPLQKASTILSGFLSGSSTEQGALFDITGTNDIDFTLEDLTIQDAYNASTDTLSSNPGYGSVLVLDNANADVMLSNLTIQRNGADVDGGAIYQTDGNLTINGAEFLNNTAGGNGGAIDHESGNLVIYNTNFDGNSADGDGGAIYNAGTMNISGSTTFTNNSADGLGNDIYNTGTINLNGDAGTVFIGDGIAGTGTIDKTGAGTLTLGTGSDSSGFTGAFGQTNGITNVAGDFFGGNSVINGGTLNWLQGAEKTAGTLEMQSGNLNIYGTLNLSANDKIDNSALVNIAQGGLLDIASGGNVTLGSTDIWDGTVLLQAGDLTLDGINNSGRTGTYLQTGGDLNVINGSNIYMNAGNVSGAGGNITIDNSTFHLSGTEVHFTSGGDMTLNNAVIDAIDNKISHNTFTGALDVSGSNNFTIDVDARNSSADSYTFANGVTGSGIIDITQVHLTSLPTGKQTIFNVFGGTVDPGVDFEIENPNINTPLGRYLMSYIGNGDFMLSLLGFNPSALRGQAATLAVYNSQLAVDKMLLDHVYLDSNELVARGVQNRYAASTAIFAPYQFSRNEGGLWFKNYANFETLSMTQDINVENNIYGTIVGADMPAVKLKHGWKFLPTAYISYNGGHQIFDGVSMWQNGGQGGFMGTFSRGGFIGSALAYAGGYNNEMLVEGFTDRTGNWFAGTALKAAYNLRPARNFILQPNVIAAYNIFGKQQWGSDFGALSMNSGYLNGINAAPGLNFIYGRETWSAYITTMYMYNINDKVNGSAGGIELPDLRMRHGYFEYGIGATKNFKERFMGWAQITLRNGGRTGVGLQFGLTWKF